MTEINDAVKQALHSFEKGDMGTAETWLAPCLARNGLSASVWELAGLVAAANGQFGVAADRFGQAATLAPQAASAGANHAAALVRLNQYEAAVDAAQRVLALHPDHGPALTALGAALHGLGRFDAAFEPLSRAVALAPQDEHALISAGAVAKDRGDLPTALSLLRRAVVVAPASADAHWNLAVTLLTNGQWEEGWAQAEWRRQHPRFGLQPHHGPEWWGDDPSGRTILVHAEQGRGDTIQFSRLIPELNRRGARVVLECQPELTRLMQTVPGVAQVVARGQALPAHDAQVPMMSLPRHLGVRPDFVPGPVRWLTAAPDRVAALRQRLGPGIKVGLVWSGQPANPVDARRSVTLATLAPLLTVTGMRFISLQHGPAAALAASAPFPILDLSGELTDFADTAAIVAALDLVITVDTAVAHLAGALGRPVWLLNRYDTCWRWLRGRDDCAWYPTLRQFRQEKPGDWSRPVARMAARLTAMAAL